MPGVAKPSSNATTLPKKLGGGLKKLAPPPGFKGKAKAAPQTDLFGVSGANTSAASNPADLLGLDVGSKPAAIGLDAILGGGAAGQPVA